jgi:hypothetical protein
VQYLHQSCFETWAGKKCEDPVQKEQIVNHLGLVCEICHHKYSYRTNITKKWASCETAKKKLIKSKMLAAASILFIVVDSILLTLMISYALRDREDPTFNISIPRFFLVYIALTFSIASLFYGIYEFIKVFFRT